MVKQNLGSALVLDVPLVRTDANPVDLPVDVVGLGLRAETTNPDDRIELPVADDSMQS